MFQYRTDKENKYEKQKNLRGLAVFMAIGLLTAFSSLFADQPAPHDGSMDIQNCAPSKILPIYQELRQVKLITDLRASKVVTPITIYTEQKISQEDAAKLIEKSLLEQAGIVLTRLDDKRVSVTHNDALPIVPKVPTAR